MRQCPRCRNREARSNGLCSACWAEYMREWRKRSKRTEYQRGVRAGIEIMRRATIARLHELDLELGFNGVTAARIVQDLRVPYA